MPIAFPGGSLRGFRRRKQETHAELATGGAEAQGPILVVGGEAGITGAALADDVNVFAVLEGVDFHPRLERERVTCGEVERTGGAGVGKREVGAGSVETHRGVARFEVGKFGRTRTGHLALNRADRDDPRNVFLAEIPAGDGRGERADRGTGSGEEERTERPHLNRCGYPDDGGQRSAMGWHVRKTNGKRPARRLGPDLRRRA